MSGCAALSDTKCCMLQRTFDTKDSEITNYSCKCHWCCQTGMKPENGSQLSAVAMLGDQGSSQLVTSH